jgi:hypothetical protein
MALPANNELAKRYAGLSAGRFYGMIQKTDDINFLIPLRNSLPAGDDVLVAMVNRRLGEISYKEYGPRFTRALPALLVPQALSRQGYLPYTPELYGYLQRQARYFLRAHVEYDSTHLQLMVLPVYTVADQIVLTSKFGLDSLGDYHPFPHVESIEIYREEYLSSACRRAAVAQGFAVIGVEVLGFIDLRQHEPFNWKVLIPVRIKTRGLPLGGTAGKLDLFSEHVINLIKNQIEERRGI